MILLIDNYDSFVHNLARYFNRLGQQTHVVRNDAIDLDQLQQLDPAAIVLSPGPCTPDQAGISLQLVEQLADSYPLLGICLGHQVIAQALGARIVPASQPVHGRTSPIEHDGEGLLRGRPNPLTACRYHSLVIDRDSLPDCLQASCWLDDGTVMGVRHRQLPVYGLQFHPESILTQHGYALLAGFLAEAGLEVVDPLPQLNRSTHRPAVIETSDPHQPVTF